MFVLREERFYSTAEMLMIALSAILTVSGVAMIMKSEDQEQEQDN